ncbi:MAG TPA: hypothetical protein VLN26_07760 [Gaiellaceae bacterium]|nr:hypothetical protein [Gaiellaceae bacterium]
MDVQEIAPGLWRWTGWHEEWREQVGCVYVERDAGIALIDPLVPPEDTERFHAALDHDAGRATAGVHVLVTVYWHTRSTRELAARHDARIWAPSRAKAAVARRAGEVTDPFRPGDPLPLGIEALATARSSEVVYWLPEHGTLVPGDVILGADGGGVRLCPESWLPDGVGHAELRASLRPLLDLPVERILVSHGEPVLAGGREALAQIL